MTQEKAPASTSINQEVDLDELMDVSLILHLPVYSLIQMYPWLFTLNGDVRTQSWKNCMQIGLLL